MLSNIPFVRTSAQKIFQGYGSLEEAFEDIDSGGFTFVQNKLGLNDSDKIVSVQAIKVYNSLCEFKEDLLEGVKNVEIIDFSNKKTLKVICSDQVGNGFNKKSEFYAYINNTFADKLHVDFMPSVTKNIDYLVWAGADGSPARYTSKVQKVERYNEKGSNIPIVTAQQFIDIVKKF